ncbi:hypothetical protein MUG78_17410 [Gordonia alkaliphila]|uniref:hypothetical protein n=1 Tax=Gordonia alkaliphila TaxID=1053547 RepID=UPI001FF282C9|nr:hypothetical protein [Gordonia alkaliphila]MCK0441180.1 hypothetical protein [Gordonia alkaliphila]
MLSHSEALRAISYFSDAAIADWLHDMAQVSTPGLTGPIRLGFAIGPGGLHEERIRGLFAIEDSWDLEGRTFSSYDIFSHAMGVSSESIGSAEQEAWMGIFCRYFADTPTPQEELLLITPAAA